MEIIVDILILGAGWTSQFLIPLCRERNVSFAATSRSGRDSTIKFDFDPDSDDPHPYHNLPKARAILITFPILKEGASERLVHLYACTHGQEGYIDDGSEKTKFIQLGTTSIWDGARMKLDGPSKPVEHRWYDRQSPYIVTPRAKAEEELLALSPGFPTTVLNLSGLWGGTRLPRNWVGKVAGSKEALKNKGSLHVIHGIDVARAILAVCNDFEKAQGQRWLLSDGRVYDWWDLASAWGTCPVGSPVTNEQTSTNETTSATYVEPNHGDQAAWVQQLMSENGIRALPRNTELLGRALDSRDFWTTFSLTPLKPRLVE